MDSVYVTTRGRIVIPVRLRRKLCIKPGTKVCFIERGSDILFQQSRRSTFEVCAACSRTQHQRLQNC
jgi:AbrB family looped-hinge helix DNA binding protein